MEFSRCEVIELELKYCERCGGLWLRRQGAEGVYCTGCTVKMPECRMATRRGGRPRLPIHSARDVHGRFSVIAGGRGERGHA